jgi:phospholipid/cholesterol/gamma-HCH transport system substrate-binding protein
MRKLIWAGILALIAFATVVSLTVAKQLKPGPQFKAYFENSSNLQTGAAVRVAGVNVGRVTAVRIMPKLKEHPVEVSMSLNPKEALDVPSDAVASLSTDGVLGPTYVEIEIQKASGPPLKNGGTLRTISVESLTPKEILDRLSRSLKERQGAEATH